MDIVISDLKGEEIVGRFLKKELKITNKKGFTDEKTTKRKDNKVYLKCKDYDSSFNNWIDKKRHNTNE